MWKETKKKTKRKENEQWIHWRETQASAKVPFLFIFISFLNGFSSLQVSRQFPTFNHEWNIGTSEGEGLRKLGSVIWTGA